MKFSRTSNKSNFCLVCTLIRSSVRRLALTSLLSWATVAGELLRVGSSLLFTTFCARLLQVILSLYVISTVGAWFNLLTLVFLGEAAAKCSALSQSGLLVGT